MATIPSPTKIRKILLATDFSHASRAAFQVAVTACKHLGASLLLLHAYELPSPVLHAEPFHQDLAIILQSLRDILAGFQSNAMEEGIHCEVRLAPGLASQAILEAIDHDEIDLAILATRAPHGVQRLCFGSTAEAVLRQARCPVMTVGPHAAMTPLAADGPVVFATDFNSVTMHAIRYAASFCESMQAPLHCLHVLPRTLEGVPAVKAMQQILDEGLQHIASESCAVLPVPVNAISYGSEVSNAIVEYANLHHARLLVLGVRQAALVTAHLPAHVAFRVITESPCPVLTMAYISQPEASVMPEAIA